ncbi:uncharacterized protein LOC135337456 [Halichondria panicea]|uniref:uncharacterized protein LOC135337456 n=1 Tax=Halichondria panicea TaxID=6063 RepID=UPI00312BAB75
MKLLQESTGKMRELERLGLALDKKVARVKGQSDATIGVNSPLTPQKKISVFTTGEAKNFLDDIFRILLRARRILSASYCIGYFIPDTDEEALGAHEVLQGKLEEAVEVVSEMVNRQYLQTPRSKMNEAARNVDYLCSEYLTEMFVVATIADLAVKEAEKPPPPRATPPTPQEDSPPPRMGVIPLGFGPAVPDQPDGERRFRLIGLLNPDGTLHILRVPEEEFQYLRAPAD